MTSRRRALLSQVGGKLWLYNAGDECTEVTGGWIQSNYHCSDGIDYYGTSGIRYGFGRFTKNADSMEVWYQHANDDRQNTNISTENLIDLTNYSKLCMECSAINIWFSNDITRIYFGLTPIGAGFVHTNFVRILNGQSSTFEGTIEIDITNIAGNYYILVDMFRLVWDCEPRITINKIWLE